ncbi:hypothetical protein TNCV_2261241 [Trichonephila clavipes]|nr:hypothetical protein TNCV_2261241 [Trichonephila clavipes]
MQYHGVGWHHDHRPHAPTDRYYSSSQIDILQQRSYVIIMLGEDFENGVCNKKKCLRGASFIFDKISITCGCEWDYDGQRYIDEVLLPHVRLLFRGAVGDKFVFMDDNATCHRTFAV